MCDEVRVNLVSTDWASSPSIYTSWNESYCCQEHLSTIDMAGLEIQGEGNFRACQKIQRPSICDHKDSKTPRIISMNDIHRSYLTNHTSQTPIPVSLHLGKTDETDQ